MQIARMAEGRRINQSLLALRRVFDALAEGNGAHVPFRESKLTQLLQARAWTRNRLGCDALRHPTESCVWRPARGLAPSRPLALATRCSRRSA